MGDPEELVDKDRFCYADFGLLIRSNATTAERTELQWLQRLLSVYGI
jgi:hypothetical protein